MATNKPRYSITLDDEMFEEVENFRFERRYANRNKATIELIRLGLESLRKENEIADNERRQADELNEHLDKIFGSEEKRA